MGTINCKVGFLTKTFWMLVRQGSLVLSPRPTGKPTYGNFKIMHRGMLINMPIVLCDHRYTMPATCKTHEKNNPDEMDTNDRCIPNQAHVTDLMQVSTTHFLNRLVVIAVLFCVSGHGSCMCDSYKSESYCDCEQGYLGADCSCPVSTLSCRTQNGTGVCSCYLTYLTTCGTFHHKRDYGC